MSHVFTCVGHWSVFPALHQRAAPTLSLHTVVSVLSKHHDTLQGSWKGALRVLDPRLAGRPCHGCAYAVSAIHRNWVFSALVMLVITSFTLILALFMMLWWKVEYANVPDLAMWIPIRWVNITVLQYFWNFNFQFQSLFQTLPPTFYCRYRSI